MRRNHQRLQAANIGRTDAKNRQNQALVQQANKTPAFIEPCLLDSYPASLADVISEVIGAATKLGQRLHPQTAASLAELVRAMNCYYSNFIEGHNTRPRDIERALSGDFDADRRTSSSATVSPSLALRRA